MARELRPISVSSDFAIEGHLVWCSDLEYGTSAVALVKKKSSEQRIDVTVTATMSRHVTRVTDGIATVTDGRPLHVISDYWSFRNHQE